MWMQSPESFPTWSDCPAEVRFPPLEPSMVSQHLHNLNPSLVCCRPVSPCPLYLRLFVRGWSLCPQLIFLSNMHISGVIVKFRLMESELKTGM